MTFTQTTKAFTAVAALAAALGAIPAASFAGECPADAAGIDVREPVDLQAVGVTDTVLATLPLSETALKIEDRTMRVRRLTIEPGGVVPWHSHGDRPALIAILSGEINEYSSTCAAPIPHPAGDVATERMEVSHWWKNLGTEPVVILSFDILHDHDDHNM